MGEELLTVREVAQELKLDRLTIYRMIADGRLPAKRLGKRGLRIPRAAVLRLLEPLTPCKGHRP